MKKSTFTEQILFALKPGDAGQPVADVCRQIGISKATYYVWRKRYANLGILEVRELRQPRDENGRLRDECLNVSEFATLSGAQAVLKSWQHDYNHHRPHGSLGFLTHSEFATKSQKTGTEAPKLQF